MTEEKELTYCEAICEAFTDLLENYPNTFVIGQGLWSPWYVGNTMKGLDKRFGKDRVIDSPTSEQACTGCAIGASLCGYRPIVVHPRMDFMVLASDAIVNQAAKWRHMLGGKQGPHVTIRSIINRGGEQGAQHSQSLHSWFAHIPGLRVVMPATVSDAYRLLILSTLSDDPVLYIDDRWLYDRKGYVQKETLKKLSEIGPEVRAVGKDITLVGVGYSAYLCEQAAQVLQELEISAEVIDLRVISPLKVDALLSSVKKTGRLLVVDGSWSNCGLAGEVIASVVQNLDPKILKAAPRRITLPAAPAPTSRVLEEIYYPKCEDIVVAAKRICKESLEELVVLF